jgi:hypothetical protein
MTDSCPECGASFADGPYAWIDHDDWDDSHRGYPADAPWVMRDQGLRAADDLVRVVIGDVADVLRAAGHVEDATKADGLYVEACALFGDEDTSTRAHWSTDGEALQWILEEAENPPHAYVEWVGDAGIVRIATDAFRELEPIEPGNPFADPANLPDVFGGVSLFAVMDDGGTLCEPCVVDPSNPVHDERENPAGQHGDGWGVIGFDTTQSTDEFLACDHCGRVLVDDTQTTDTEE